MEDCLGVEDDSEYDLRIEEAKSMEIKQIEVSRTFNCGNYESEKISLTTEIPTDGSLVESYFALHEDIEMLHRIGPYRGTGLRKKV